MTRNRRRPGAWLLAGVVLAVVLTLYGADRTGVGDPEAVPSAIPTGSAAGPAAPPTGGTPSPSTASPPPPPEAGPPPPAPATTTACTSPGSCGFPDEHSTGPRIALERHDTGNMTIRKDGTVIRGWDIRGSLDIYADDVTVIDSRITSTNWWGINLRPGFSGLKVLHTAITAVPGKGPDNGGVNYAVSNMGGSSIEVGWCDISVFGNALSMGQGDLHDNYVHDLVAFRNQGGEWQHTDAVISGGGNTGRLTVRHNTLLNATPVAQGATAAVGLFADTGFVSSVVVEDNWLAGGAYALYGGGPGATGIKVTGNVFSTQYHPASGAYGPVTAWNAGGAGNVWEDNRMSDGRPVQPAP
ncbi:hypothetical protein [Streptomyces sp. NRRL F-2664]|uniref:hypothetical protein n=1 Tax=Streptomyces sp. NRRL F-2664 TaxID=1463842 RepID=UPI00068E5101|nr:hypothetical protein [Streptomyces sp. NRRL F-2664]